MRHCFIWIVAGTFVLAVGCKGKKSEKPQAKDKAESRAGGEAGKTAADPGPEQAWKAFAAAVSKGDADGIWAFISDKSKKWLTTGPQGQRINAVKALPDEILGRLAAAAKTTVPAMKKMNTAELARAVMVAEVMKNKARVTGSKFKEAKVEGNTAIITVTVPDRGPKRYALIKEGGKWKLDGEETKKLEQAKK